MNTKYIWLSFIAVIISFIGGFLLANALNRSEINQIRSEVERQGKSQTESNPNSEETTLSDDEIKKRIVEADQNPTNYEFQKNLGLALYRYAGMKQNAELLGEVTRLLDRANKNDPTDYDVIVALGNSFFDIGLLKKENENLQKSRKYYQEALKLKPEDVEIRTDLGLSYLLINPPEADKAIVEFEKSLQKDPKHEKTLRAISQAYLSLKKIPEAEKYISQLKNANPQSVHLSELQTQLEQEKTKTETK